MESLTLTDSEYSQKVNESFYLDGKIKVWLKNGLSFSGTVSECNFPDRELSLYNEGRLTILNIVSNPIVAYPIIEKN